ncbi:sulfonate transport system substrate-binding protein [Sedimentibacter acidaminivorans]|jgi:sulfonate transport system substrate-binding protein|uniref:Sulfonate transport system substrate-binding protein n=1 Tax=Sedimentibacter acidaminivorans TaxID=913099 RepID=A0ABS4GEL1_9FIRM|nr:NrtA/SsuA/CpmA family ABC transporter substrate-binding protein [Sedimentibacter acidaminivorans]MBP1926072.1 sulfonate transport system substrate-binding protein [Sedimentibacter acidaminivorans]
MKKNLLITLVLALIVVTVTGCSTKNEIPSNGTSEEAKFYNASKIAVTYVKSPLNVPSIIEKNKGFFQQHFDEYNLPVEYSNLTTGPEQTQALASGDLQFLNAVGATSVILAASNGSDIKIISMYSRSPKAFMLFANDSQIKTAADLKGKKVAGPKGTILHELLIAYLKTAGLTEKDIEFISLGIPDSQAALVSGEVDAALLAGPAAYNIKKAGNMVLTTGEGLVDATIVVATSQKFYDENKVLVDTYLKAQKFTLDYMRKNYDEIVQITAEETELSIDAVKEMYTMYDFIMEITDKDIEGMKKTEQFLFDNKMIDNHVDITDILIK